MQNSGQVGLLKQIDLGLTLAGREDDRTAFTLTTLEQCHDVRAAALALAEGVLTSCPRRELFISTFGDTYVVPL